VGTIEPRKNLPTLFSAFERLVQTRPGTPPLILAGRAVEHSGAILDALGTRPLLAANVRYLGYVSDEERIRLYREASMLILPSLEEGFGMTALEAMHMGLPVVASNRGALPEVLGHAGSLVDPSNPEGLASAIAELLDNPRMRAAYAEAGRARASQFTWVSSAAHLLEGYRRVLSRRTEVAC
jgi:glycosyltransferase involved in cell wall biosynthesis